MMTPRDVLPVGWTSLLRKGRLTWGLDIGATEKKTSNPSSLVITEDWANMYRERVVLAWKTKDGEVTIAILALMFEDAAAAGAKFWCGCVDASNETLFAKRIRDLYRKYCPIHLIKGGEKITHKMRDWDAKTLLGSLYVNAYTDFKIATPQQEWIKQDRLLVKRNGAKFEAELGKEGQHGDTFDGGKLSLWGHLKGGGRAEAAGAAVSEGATSPQGSGRKLLNPYAHLHESGAAKINL